MQAAIHLQIVQSGKDTLLADAQAPRDHALFQIRIGLKRGFKQRTDKADHFFVEAMQISVLERYVVLIDEDDGIVPMIFRQAFGEEAKCFGIFFLVASAKHDPFKDFTIARRHLTLQHVTVPLKLLADLINKASISGLEIVLFRRLQAHEDHRILLLMLEDLFPATCDRQSVKEIAIVDFFAFFGDLILKEAPDHKLVQRLAEAAWPHEQRDHGVAFDQLSDHQRFVHKITVPVNQRFEILHSDGDLLAFFGTAHSDSLLSSHRSAHFPHAFTHVIHYLSYTGIRKKKQAKSTRRARPSA